MTLSATYDEAVRIYSDQARAILTPGAAATERTIRDLPQAALLADQAEALAPLSAGLREIAIAQTQRPLASDTRAGCDPIAGAGRH